MNMTKLDAMSQLILYVSFDAKLVQPFIKQDHSPSHVKALNMFLDCYTI